MAELMDKELEQVDGGAMIGGGQKEEDGAVWIGGATNPIAGSTDGAQWNPGMFTSTDDNLGNPS